MFCDLVEGWNPFMSSALIRRAVLLEAGGFDERLRATEDHDLWIRLAQRTDFAGASDVLLIRHERHGPQLSRNPDFMPATPPSSPGSGGTRSRRRAGAGPIGAGS